MICSLFSLCPAAPLPRCDQFEHLSRFRVPPQRLLGEHELAVDGNLKESPGRLHQPDLGIGVGLLQLGRQTGGPGSIVSDNAVLDNHMHGATPGREVEEGPPRIVVAP